MQRFPLSLALILGAPFLSAAEPGGGIKTGRTTGIKDYDVITRKIQQQRAEHWAFRRIARPSLPAVRAAAGAATPVDRFILAKLEAEGLSPSPVADRRTLIRRLLIDLTGLPPTAEQIEAFERDLAPDNYEKLVERVLASPQYGERWGRFWLDVARYADSKGYVFQEERRYPFAFTYRDYVIRAFNADVPYDRFITEQLAADRLPLGDDKQPLAALGFLTLGRRFLNNVHDIIDDRIDVTTRGLMGLTVACARCHDHKYDPVPTRDYYSLHGVFASSVEPRELPVLTERTLGPKGDEFQKVFNRLKAEYADFEKANEKELKAGNRKFRDQLRAIKRKIDAHLAGHPGSPPRAMVLNDAANPTNPRVLQRGNPGMPGDSVPRQFLEVIAGPARQPFKDGSGRLELAKSIASPDNPLTARVLVNRVWTWHFGAGLVTTPSDFGLRSAPPSHPELLDYLAARFMAEGWSIKKLHRWIVLSNTYRQTSIAESSSIGQSLDPDNRLLWRMNRKRLEYEALRDSALFVAGRLDPTPGGPAVDMSRPSLSRRRTVYGFVDRQNLPGTMRVFDFASPDAHCPQRFTTTVPQQALFLMNSSFAQEQADALTSRARAADPAQRIEQLYLLAFARKPTAEEIALGLAYLKDDGSEDAWARYAQVLLASNEFVFVD